MKSILLLTMLVIAISAVAQDKAQIYLTDKDECQRLIQESDRAKCISATSDGKQFEVGDRPIKQKSDNKESNPANQEPSNQEQKVSDGTTHMLLGVMLALEIASIIFTMIALN